MAQPTRKELGDRPRVEASQRFHIDCHLVGDRRATMIADVRHGLSATPKTLPAKYLYDERGARLFEQICEQPEYYPTRTEEALLGAVASAIIETCRPAQLVELGSGASRKTHLLLDALTESRDDVCYVPVDVSEEMLRRSAEQLRVEYPGLALHGVVGDYEQHLRYIPDSDERMVIFLGSTIGNFTAIEGRCFLRSLRNQLSAGDALLIGFDLVKPAAVLDAAYNDAAGVTAEFNRNVLCILNRELDADFDLDAFAHEAFYDVAAEQIEMHLRVAQAQRVRIAAAGMTVDFAAGESVRTEISRKFTRGSASNMLAAGGFAPRQWYVSPDDYFALALALAAPVV